MYIVGEEHNIWNNLPDWTSSNIELPPLRVCITAIDKLRHQGKLKIGGHRCFVMLDESKFSHKRKFSSVY